MTKTKPKTFTGLFTNYPRLTHSEANALFAKSASKPKDGGNSHLADFLAALDMITSTKGSFTQSDLLYACAPYDIPALEVQSLLRQWIAKMESLSKVEVIRGCYDEDVIVLI